MTNDETARLMTEAVLMSPKEAFERISTMFMSVLANSPETTPEITGLIRVYFGLEYDSLTALGHIRVEKVTRTDYVGSCTEYAIGYLADFRAMYAGMRKCSVTKGH